MFRAEGGGQSVSARNLSGLTQTIQTVNAPTGSLVDLTTPQNEDDVEAGIKKTQQELFHLGWNAKGAMVHDPKAIAYPVYAGAHEGTRNALSSAMLGIMKGAGNESQKRVEDLRRGAAGNLFKLHDYIAKNIPTHKDGLSEVGAFVTSYAAKKKA